MLGRIYKIIVSTSNKSYIGSTFQELRHRWQEHKNRYKAYLKGCKGQYTSTFDLFEEFGLENCKIVLIKEYEVVDRAHLEVYESLWIFKLNSINKYIPFRIHHLSEKKYYLENKEKIKERKGKYRLENKEGIKERQKKYRLENKEELKEYSIQYYLENKEKINEQKRQYHIQNKEKLNERCRQYRLQKMMTKYACECGSVITVGAKYRHEKTKKHLTFVDAQVLQPEPEVVVQSVQGTERA